MVNVSMRHTLTANLYIGLMKSDLAFQIRLIGLINARSISVKVIKSNKPKLK